MVLKGGIVIKIICVACLACLSTLAAAQTKRELIQRSDVPFSPSGVISQVEGSYIEKGVIDDVPYSFYYSDGSGTFAGTKGNVLSIREPYTSNWSVYCNKDQITDKKSCVMSMNGLLLIVRPKGITTVHIGAEHFPRSSITIRIDGGKPQSASNGGPFSPQVSAGLVKHLSSANTVTTRYMEWPYDVWDDKTFEIFGFKETYSYVRWAVEKIK
jgi:hypothetical protein